MLLCVRPRGRVRLVLNRPTEMPATSMVKLDHAHHRRRILAMHWRPSNRSAADPDGNAPKRPDHSEIQEELSCPRHPPSCAGCCRRCRRRHARVLAGCAGGDDQLDMELAHSAWLMGDVGPDLVFEVQSGSMWDTAINGSARPGRVTDEPRRPLTVGSRQSSSAVAVFRQSTERRRSLLQSRQWRLMLQDSTASLTTICRLRLLTADRRLPTVCRLPADCDCRLRPRLTTESLPSEHFLEERQRPGPATDLARTSPAYLGSRSSGRR